MRFFLTTLALLTGSSAAALPLDTANLQSAAAYSRQQRGDALLIFRHGRQVFAEGENGFDLQRPHALASGSKSFACALAVRLLDQGQLSSLDERASDILTEWSSDPLKRDITVRELLSLTSGLPGGVSHVPVGEQDDNFAEGLNAPVLTNPGSRFSYGPLHLAAFGLLVQRRTGQDPAAYLQREILDPIGARAVWARDRKGQPNLARGALMSAHDWALYGHLILQGGRWNGRQLLSGAGLAQCFQGSAAQPAYGLTWWLNVPFAAATDGSPDGNPDGNADAPVQLNGGRTRLAPTAPENVVLAAGALNQRLYLLPDQDAVVVRFGRGGSWSDDALLKRLLGAR